MKILNSLYFNAMPCERSASPNCWDKDSLMATLMWEASRYATTPLTRAGHEFAVQSQDVGLILKYPGENIASDFAVSLH